MKKPKRRFVVAFPNGNDCVRDFLLIVELATKTTWATVPVREYDYLLTLEAAQEIADIYERIAP